jgi:hypothetical protein
MNKETEHYSWLLESYISQVVDRLNQFSDVQWPWHPSLPVPSAQMLATSALEWMVCDRHHILEPDAQFHEQIPPTPEERAKVIECLKAESKEWIRMLSQIRVEDLDAPRRQFNRLDADHQDVRWMMLHTIDNLVQKLGEITVLSLALGHDGTEPYENKLPRECYERLRRPMD